MKKRDILLAGGIVLVALVMLLVMHIASVQSENEQNAEKSGRNERACQFLYWKTLGKMR